MQKYYLALQKSLQGYYVVFIALSADIVKEHAQKHLGQIGAPVYNETMMLSMKHKIGDYSMCHIINEHNPIKLLTPDKWE